MTQPEKSLILAIETSGRIGSIAIGTNDTIIEEYVFSGFMKHSAELFPQIQCILDKNCLVPAKIRDLYITAGPGSFTGLRIAVTAAKMFYFAQQVNIIAADSVDVLVENATQFEKESGVTIEYVCTILDAKKDLFFTGVFRKNTHSWEKILGTELIRAEDLMSYLEKLKKPVYLLGEGLLYYSDRFKSDFSHILDQKYWSAKASGLFYAGKKLAAKGQYADPLALKPAYIRKPEAVEQWEKRQQSRI